MGVKPSSKPSLQPSFILSSSPSLQPSSIPSLSPSSSSNPTWASSPSVTPSFNGYCLDKNGNSNFNPCYLGKKENAEECLARCKTYAIANPTTPISACEYSKASKRCDAHKDILLLPPITFSASSAAICWPLS